MTAGQAGSQKQALPPPSCQCGEPATERVSWTTNNPERKFYKCSQAKVSLASCVSACSAAEAQCVLIIFERLHSRAAGAWVQELLQTRSHEGVNVKTAPQYFSGGKCKQIA